MGLVMPHDGEHRASDDSSGVHTHLTILQGVISRMASNSQSCKTWCVTIVAAVFIVSVNTTIDGLSLIALLPALLLGWLDMYYLGLERSFRTSYNKFVAALALGTVPSGNLFVVRPTKDDFSSWLACIKSPSIWPFYSALIIVTVVVAAVVHFTGEQSAMDSPEEHQQVQAAEQQSVN